MGSALKHKSIRLIPTNIEVEVFIGDIKEIVKSLKKRFGGKKSFWKETVGTDTCAVLADNRIFLFIMNYSIPVIAHEVLHATSYLSMLTGIKMDSDNDEIQAYYMEYMMEEILKM